MAENTLIPRLELALLSTTNAAQEVRLAKAFRTRTGASLSEAKLAVEAWMATHPAP